MRAGCLRILLPGARCLAEQEYTPLPFGPCKHYNLHPGWNRYPVQFPPGTDDAAMSEEDNINLRMQLAELELEHADLGKAVDALTRVGGDLLCIQRLKKKKLALKDEIASLRVRVTPDIIA